MRRFFSISQLCPRPRRAIGLALLAAACADPTPDPQRPQAGLSPQPLETTPPNAAAASAGSNHYTLRFEDRAHHYVHVEATLPAATGDVELWMPTWTPGSYLVREYARHVERLVVFDAEGAPLSVEKTAKNRWRVHTEVPTTLQVSYRVYSRELGVQTNFVDEDLAILNGAPTFLTVAGHEGRAHEVRVELPESWQGVYTGLPPVNGAPTPTFVAQDYDTLVDSPITAGTADVRRFEVDGRPHRLVLLPDDPLWDGEQSAGDVQRIVEANLEFWGAPLPYEDYTFLNALVETRGGLEHRNSTLMMISRWNTRDREDYTSWLGLVSHEFFHTWNVKRLRPRPLGPFDYENEVHTSSLWIAEGFTSYYDDLLLRRAGLVDDAEYFDLLGRQLDRLDATPGRGEQSLEMASFDAWTHYYRRHANSVNTGVSYYNKGAVAAFVLDAAIREASGGARALDDVMRAAYARFSGESGYTPAEFEAVASEVAGTDMGPLFATVARSTEELDLEPALSWFGLERVAKEGDDKGSLGIAFDNRDGRIHLSTVRRGTPAWDAGLLSGDELLAVDGLRVTPDTLSHHVERLTPGQDVALLVSRRGRLREIPATVASKAPEERPLSVRAEPTAEQTAHLRAWLGPLADEDTDEDHD